MEKFSKILESKEEPTWEVKVEVSLFVSAANEGEASYLAEDAIQGLKYDKEMVISSVTKQK